MHGRGIRKQRLNQSLGICTYPPPIAQESGAQETFLGNPRNLENLHEVASGKPFLAQGTSAIAGMARGNSLEATPAQETQNTTFESHLLFKNMGRTLHFRNIYLIFGGKIKKLLGLRFSTEQLGRHY